MSEANRAVMDFEAAIFPLATVPPTEFLIETPNATCAESYCRKCIDAAMAIEKAKYPEGADVYKACGSGENDHSLNCDGCGCLLAYSLTDYGASSELDHFNRARGWSRKGLHPDVAFELCAMLRVIAWRKEPAAIAAAIRVGKRAVTAMSRVGVAKAGDSSR